MFAEKAQKIDHDDSNWQTIPTRASSGPTTRSTAKMMKGENKENEVPGGQYSNVSHQTQHALHKAKHKVAHRAQELSNIARDTVNQMHLSEKANVASAKIAEGARYAGEKATEHYHYAKQRAGEGTQFAKRKVGGNVEYVENAAQRGRSRVSSSQAARKSTSKKRSGFSIKRLLATGLLAYVTYAYFWLCPSETQARGWNKGKLIKNPHTICKAMYSFQHDFLEPIAIPAWKQNVVPVYNENIHPHVKPYLDKAHIHYDSYGKPLVVTAQRAHEIYGKPALANTQQVYYKYGHPVAMSAQKQVYDQYKIYAKPTVDQYSKQVKVYYKKNYEPHVKAAQKKADQFYKKQIIPAYKRAKPVVIQLWNKAKPHIVKGAVFTQRQVQTYVIPAANTARGHVVHQYRTQIEPKFRQHVLPIWTDRIWPVLYHFYVTHLAPRIQYVSSKVQEYTSEEKLAEAKAYLARQAATAQEYIAEQANAASSVVSDKAATASAYAGERLSEAQSIANEKLARASKTAADAAMEASRSAESMYKDVHKTASSYANSAYTQAAAAATSEDSKAQASASSAYEQAHASVSSLAKQAAASAYSMSKQASEQMASASARADSDGKQKLFEAPNPERGRPAAGSSASSMSSQAAQSTDTAKQKIFDAKDDLVKNLRQKISEKLAGAAGAAGGAKIGKKILEHVHGDKDEKSAKEQAAETLAGMAGAKLGKNAAESVVEKPIDEKTIPVASNVPKAGGKKEMNQYVKEQVAEIQRLAKEENAKLEKEYARIRQAVSNHFKSQVEPQTKKVQKLAKDELKSIGDLVAILARDKTVSKEDKISQVSSKVKLSSVNIKKQVANTTSSLQDAVDNAYKSLELAHQNAENAIKKLVHESQHAMRLMEQENEGIKKKQGKKAEDKIHKAGDAALKAIKIEDPRVEAAKREIKASADKLSTGVDKWYATVVDELNSVLKDAKSKVGKQGIFGKIFGG